MSDQAAHNTAPLVVCGVCCRSWRKGERPTCTLTGTDAAFWREVPEDTDDRP